MIHIIQDIKNFTDAMGKLRLGVVIWAGLFPFPQFIFGVYFIYTRGIYSPSNHIFWARTISFIIAGQIHKKNPNSKIIAPIMHIPLYLLFPILISWMCGNVAFDDPYQFNYILYTTTISIIACVLDTITMIKWITTGSSGTYKRDINLQNRHFLIKPPFPLIIPSLIFVGLSYGRIIPVPIITF